MALSIRDKRVQRTPIENKPESKRSFVESVTEAARGVLLHGNRQTVELNEGYYRLFMEAKNLLMKVDTHYPMREQKVFEQAASLVLKRYSRFQGLRVTSSVITERTGVSKVRLYIRPKS